MKRFFCTICNKIKRTQQIPHVIENADSEVPELRVGHCNRHDSGRELARVEKRVPVNMNLSRKVS